MSHFDVVVMGSCMIDLVCYAPRLPKNGETLHGSKFSLGHGGKGANQCVASSKLGASSCLIARLGNDNFGKEYKESLKQMGINVDNILLTENESSGMAQITVAENGDNQIVIVAGANNHLSFDDIKTVGNVILDSKVIIFQFETPLKTTIETLKFIHKNKKGNYPLTIVNGAPAMPDVDSDLYKLCDIFCVNESETEAITKYPVTLSNAPEATKKLLDLGCKTVIITLGSRGAIFGSQESEIQHVGADPVVPVDTTGAGDAFVGAFAFFSAKFKNLSMTEKVKRSCKVASESVLHMGTQTSFPFRSSLPEALFVES